MHPRFASAYSCGPISALVTTSVVTYVRQTIGAADDATNQMH